MSMKFQTDDLLVRLRWAQAVWTIALCLVTYKFFERQGWSVITILAAMYSASSMLSTGRAWMLALGRKKAGKTQV